MDPEAEKRIELARQKAQREKETAEFISSLSSNDDIIKPIYSPEAYVIRSQARAAAERGSIVQTGCKHPLTNIVQIVDTDPSVLRKDKPINLFRCGICDCPMWLCDPWGAIVGDG